MSFVIYFFVNIIVIIILFFGKDIVNQEEKKKTQKPSPTLWGGTYMSTFVSVGVNSFAIRIGGLHNHKIRDKFTL